MNIDLQNTNEHTQKSDNDSDNIAEQDLTEQKISEQGLSEQDLDEQEDFENKLNNPVQQSTTSFDLVNAQQSAAIFRQFNQGKVITKLVFDDINAKNIDNALFTCLFNSSQHFELLYQHLGYELCLHSAGDFYYVRELRADSSDEADDNALKVQAILLQLGRYYSQTGRELEQLCQIQFGFNETDLMVLSKDDESLAILKAIKIENWSKAVDFITSRNFAYKTGSNSWFISSAGKAFLFNLVEQYSQFEQG
ncbi:condensin complex protein MksE [Colwellia echini]|uniref:Uncharacterized protein n=1 Tax=Colwellia echini TaxID=1982103 RepID=A0ABY3N0A4_9GAMM|nr:hypothetical protein [Colwellia echini]TYK66913.1 hypothetical protein CWS31_003795 [Colwellia echini]